MPINKLYQPTVSYNDFNHNVAHLDGRYTSPTRPVKVRTAIRNAVVCSDNSMINSCTYAVDPTVPSQRATAELTILNNTFSERTIFSIHVYDFIAGIHWIVGGSINDSATNLAQAISRLTDFDAVAVGPVISIEGFYGVAGYNVRIGIINAGPSVNFALNTNYYMIPPASTQDGITT